VTESVRLRLFVAVSVPPAQLAALERAVEPLRRALPDARWSPTSNLHITLKFLGWTDATLFERVVAVMKAVAAQHRPSTVAIEGLGAFPSRRRARVVWAGIDDSAGLLPALARDLDEGLTPLGFEVEARPFTAHLTVALIKNPRAVSLDDVSVEADEWQVDAIELFRSHLSPKGARYESLVAESLVGV
jgi:2'-5' RNA ligase